MQRQLRTEFLLQEPDLLPYVLRQIIAKQLPKTRTATEAQINDGLRISLSLANPMKDVGFAQRAFVNFTTTSASRQNFYIIVFGAVYAFNGYIEEVFKDDPLIASVLQGLLVMAAVTVAYPFFYGVHDRAEGKEGRQPLPGGDGERELPQMPTQNQLVRAIHEQSESVKSFVEVAPHRVGSGSASKSSGSSTSSLY